MKAACPPTRKSPSPRHGFAVALSALLALCGVMTLQAATAIYNIAEALDDGYYVSSTGENYTDQAAACGKHPDYSAPYVAGVFRFANVTIPQGSVISSAYLRVCAYVNGTGASVLDIRGENYDNAAPLNQGDLLSARNFTAGLNWNINSAFQEDQYYNSPEIKTIVQAIVNRSGWASGNALAIHLRNTASSTGYQMLYTKEGADIWPGDAAQLIVTYAGDAPTTPGVKAENYIPGAFDTPPSLPLYLNNPDMYYPDASGGLCWASANAGVFAYWDRNAYNGVKYWNLVDNGTAPLREPALPTAPGHDQADVKSVVAWLAHQYYGLGRNEATILNEFANASNGLSFAASYHGPADTTSAKTTLLNTIKTEIDAGRPLSAGSWGTYFGGPHQVPVMGYKEMSNTVDSTIYIHRNVGGTQSEYVNFFASSWGNLDMNKIVPGGTPVDHYEAMGDNTAATTVTIDPDHVYNFRQTRNFSFAGDADWIRLNAVAGRKYTIATRNLGVSCDTVMQLYASNGTTLLAQDDDSGAETGASKIIWDCYATSTVLIRVTEKSSRSGHATNYDVQVSWQSGTDPQNFTISTASSPSNGGTTGGGGVYAGGGSCTVTAASNAGYSFANWTEGGTVVSASASYTFTVSGDRTLTANFTVVQVINLQNGVAVANLAGAQGSTDKEYRLAVPANASSLQIAISGGSGDCDLYVRYGARSTTSDYDYRPYLYGNNETVTVSNPASGDWYIMLHGYSAYSGVTLLASYVIPTYTISTASIPSAGGTTGGGGSYEAGSSCTVTAAANTGYSFANWTEGATVVSASASYTFTVSGSRTLTANFTANPYTVTFDAQGGTVEPATTTVTYGAAYGALPTPARAGHIFGGWWTGSGGAGTQVTDATTVTTAAAHTLYAKWTPITYTVTYNGNGATGGTTPDSAHIYDSARALSANGYIRAGHVFEGWATSAEGPAVYSDGQSIVNLAAVQGATVTLHAVWSSLGTNLVLPANGGVLESFTSQNSTTTYKAANLTDGSAANIWRSTSRPRNDQVFEYSFANGQSALLNGITLVNVSGSYASKDFEIWALPPEGQWAKVFEGVLAKSVQPQSFALGGVLAIRARLVIVSGYSSTYWELAEFELYGNLIDPPLTSAVTRTGASPTAAGILGFAVAFARPVIGFGPDDVSLRFTGTASGTLGNFAGNGAAYTFDVTGVSGDGEIAASVAAGVCEDAGGMPNEASGEAVYLADNTPPEAGAASAPAAQDGGAVEVTYAGASDSGSGLRHVELWHSLNNGAWQYSGLQATAAVGAFAFQPPSSGNYAFGLVAEDNAGNRSAAPTGQGDTRTDYTVPAVPVNLVLPANGGKLESYTSQNSTTTYKAANLTDGSAANIWRSASMPRAQTFEYSFEAGQPARLTAARVFNRSTTYASKGFEIWVLPSGGQWAKVLEGVLAKSATAQEFDLGGVDAERVRLVIVSGYSSIYWELAEFELYGFLNVPTRPADKWYADHGFEPGPDETWEDLDTRPVPDKGTTLWQEYVADTDPNDPSSVFRVTGLNPGPPVSVGFVPASTQRVYRLQYTDDLASGVWHDVGAAPRTGEGEGDALTDGQAPAGRRFYRVQVNLPE